MFVDSSSSLIPHPDPGDVLRHGKKPWFPSYRGLKWRGIIFGNIWSEDGATIAHARPGTRQSRESSVFWAPTLISSSGSEAETGNKTCQVVINNFCWSQQIVQIMNCVFMYDIMYYLQQTEAEVEFWENYKRAQNYFIPVGHHLACNQWPSFTWSNHLQINI